MLTLKVGAPKFRRVRRDCLIEFIRAFLRNSPEPSRSSRLIQCDKACVGSRCLGLESEHDLLNWCAFPTANCARPLLLSSAVFLKPVQELVAHCSSVSGALCGASSLTSRRRSARISWILLLRVNILPSSHNRLIVSCRDACLDCSLCLLLLSQV